MKVGSKLGKKVRTGSLPEKVSYGNQFAMETWKLGAEPFDLK
jgi:hypothetical protein